MDSDKVLDSYADIPDRMLWKGAALVQIDNFKALAERLGLSWVPLRVSSPSLCLQPSRGRCATFPGN
jgi:hypothetical protein